MKLYKALQVSKQDLYKQILEDYKNQLMEHDEDYFFSGDWKNKGFSCFGKKRKKVLFLMGEMILERYYYYNRKTKQGYFYIDEKVDLKKYSRLGGDVYEFIYENFGDMSISKIMAKTKVSKQTIYNVMNKIGSKKIVEEIVPNEELEIIYLQADEDHDRLQKQEGRVHSIQSRVVTLYERRIKECEGRYRLVGKRQFLFSSKTSAEDIWLKVNDYLQFKYPNLKHIYFGSDAGHWITSSKKFLDVGKVTYVYDKFHLEKNLTTIFTKGHKNRKIAYDLIKDQNAYGFAKLYYQHIVDEDRERKYIHVAFMTIMNHWEAVINNFTIKNYFGTSAESQVSHYLARYLSSRPKAFAIKSFANYLRVMEYKLNNISYDDYLEADEVIEDSYFKVYEEPKDNFSMDYGAGSNIAILNHSTNSNLRKVFQQLIS